MVHTSRAADTTATLFRPIQGGQDWSVGDGLRFWFHGTGKGDAIRFQLHDNRAPDAGPSSWRLVWSDEFNGPAGRKPDSRNWTHEIGDGTANGIPGWGNNELEYYTDDAQNAATNGAGNLPSRHVSRMVRSTATTARVSSPRRG